MERSRLLVTDAAELPLRQATGSLITTLGVNLMNISIRQLFFSRCNNSIFRDLFDGVAAPECIEYWFRPLPLDAHSPIPSSYVSGKRLHPLFYGCDYYSVYMIEEETGKFYEIDPEAPWPPTFEADTWDEFSAHFFQQLSEDQEEAFVMELRNLLMPNSEFNRESPNA